MKKISKILIIILAIFAAGNLLVMIAHADPNSDEDSQTSSTTDSSTASNNTSIDIACQNYHYPWCSSQPSGIADLVGKFYQYALAAVGVAALGAIIYGGILWAMSGNPSGSQDAKKWIMGAIYGLILLLAAYLILSKINPNLTKLTEPGITPLPR